VTKLLYRIIEPYRVCRLIGHSREGYNAGGYTDRRGRWRQRWHQRCRRCGTSDGGEVYNQGALEWMRPRNLRRRYYEMTRRIGRWWREDCIACHKPAVRFGKAWGDHSGCDDDIPF